MGLRELVSGRDDTHIVFPVHLNPAVQDPVNRILGDAENVSLVPPLEYPALIWLMERSYFVMTDSGGIQEEATGFSKPVLVLRDDTERYEGLESGMAKLIGPRRDAIVAEGRLLLEDDAAYARMLSAGSPYGDGHAAERIVAALAGTAETRAAPPADPWAALGARVESMIAEEGEFGFPRRLVSRLAERLTPG
jgi:UDP-N-acetylglucosamine 2-epimerase (non-hydrolysing)